MAKEIELKLGIVDGNESVLDRLKECFSELGIENDMQSKVLQNTYFDTPDKKLNQHRMALRIRKKGNSYIQTLKTKGRSVNGLSERGEWEWDRPEPKLDFVVLEQLDVWPDGMALSKLSPAFETNFTRYQTVLSWEGGEIELAFDKGEVVAGSDSLPILEIELELISGKPEVLNSLAIKLESYIQLKPSDISKAERGYSLLQNQ